MHLQCADSSDHHDRIGLNTGHPTLEIPEFLKSNVRPEAALCHVVIAQLGSDHVGDNRALAYSDIGERPRMHKYGLALDGLQQVRIYRIDHPGGHSAVYLEVGGRYFVALLVVSHYDFGDALTHVLEIAGDREDRHYFAGDGDLEARVHLEAVHLAALAYPDVAQSLGTEVHGPFHLNGVGVDIYSFQVAFCQPGIVIVAFVLHARVKRDHTKIVSVGDTVDIARQADGKRRQWNTLRQAPAGGGTLNIESRPAAGLADRADDAFV